MEMTVLMDFEICDDHIKTPQGSYYFYRILPPNLSILSEAEKELKIIRFEAFLNSNDQPFQIIALDKTEDLKRNKQFWQDETDVHYDFVAKEIIRAIEELQGDSNGVLRAYYIGLCQRRKTDVSSFLDLLKNNELEGYLTKKDELITVMRNFLLREFSDFDIHTFDKEVQRLYEQQRYE